MVQLFTKYVLPDSIVGQPLSVVSLSNLNVSLTEFVEHYRTSQGKHVVPEAAKVRVFRPHPLPSLHSLRKTMITNLMQAQWTDSQISLRTGHANVQSLRPYAYILGEHGLVQQANLLGGSSRRTMVPDAEKEMGSSSTKRGNEADELLDAKKNRRSQLLLVRSWIALLKHQAGI